MSNRYRVIAAAAAVCIMAAPAAAQQAVTAEPVRAAPATIMVRPAPVLPALRLEYSGVSAREQALAAPAVLLPAQQRRGSNVAMMGVGVAALVVGALIGGDAGTIIMVGGAAVGLYGLYGYLR